MVKTVKTPLFNFINQQGTSVGGVGERLVVPPIATSTIYQVIQITVGEIGVFLSSEFRVQSSEPLTLNSGSGALRGSAVLLTLNSLDKHQFHQFTNSKLKPL